MNTFIRGLVLLIVLSFIASSSALARESNEPSESPRSSNTPKVSASVRPVESSAGDMRDEENELKQLEEDLNEEEDAIETPEIEVPKELEVKARKMVDDDEDITDVHVSSEEKSVEVKYRLRARLFGFIDVPYELQARVDAKEGTIKANGPWWLLFARDNAAAVQTALEADPSLVTSTNQGTVLSKMISVLKDIASR